MKRCEWSNSRQIYMDYHDREWGRPVHDDRKLFEAVILDTFQAGLSWLIILQKREHFRNAFCDFDAGRVAAFDEGKIRELCMDKGIVRNRLKIRAAVSNAAIFLKLQSEFGSFDNYIWQFTGHSTIHNKWESGEHIPVSSPESDAMSRDLKSRGFKFAGTTICYAFMQAVGMINDHLTHCFAYREILTEANRQASVQQ